MIIAGIDPGLSGALAFYDTGTGEVETIDMPTLAVSNGRREVDAHAVADLFWKRHAGHAFIEQSWPRPKDGAVQGFKFGDGYGALRGVLAAVGVPYTPVSPQRWKHALGVSADKDAARARAKQLLPQAAGQWPLKKHDGRAEAALIAYYGARELAAIAKDLPSHEDADAIASAALEAAE